ncbi:hypothetical protein [Pseudoduganella dura]|uniref:hypothetical protein n=1 Tax=Pseudoduganella dura TaxID=321982 RepID=UPI001566BB53|nr:hypothetical protein [Pseudoduganella dura]GGX83542.1 hypothetical protein GCM10007386_13050 [Pseudoduganella dura]
MKKFWIYGVVVVVVSTVLSWSNLNGSPSRGAYRTGSTWSSNTGGGSWGGGGGHK